jgi:hypothetical protein
MHYMKIKWREFPMAMGRGRRREHPTDTSEGVTWPLVITGVAQLPVAYAHTQGNPEGVNWPLVTSGSHGTTVLVLREKKTRGKPGHAQSILPVRATSGQGLFRSRDFATSGQKAPLGRILRNLRLRMRRSYFRTGHITYVTSGHVTSESTTSQHDLKW